MPDPHSDHRWPRRVYGVGEEPDPRFSFANERTFLAWIRTALGFVAAGVAVAAVSSLDARTGIEVKVAALLLIACGLVSGAGALSQWMRNERAMRLGAALPSSPLLPVLTAMVVVVGLSSLVVVVLG